MIRNPLAFYTIDRGTATTAAALVARVGDRFRLLSARSMPAGLPLDALLGSLAAQAAAVDADLLPAHEAWPQWPRLEAASVAPGRICLAAATERRLAQLEMAAANAGWLVAGRLAPDRSDALEATTACLDRDLDAVVVGAGDPMPPEERAAVADVVALVAAAVAARDDLLVVLAGAAGEHAGRFRPERVVLAPAPDAAVSAQRTPLRDLLERLAGRRLPPATQGGRTPGSRSGFRAAVGSLAVLLDRRVEGLDVGHSAGSRVLASPAEAVGSLVRADGALVPDAPASDDRPLDEVLAWSPIRGDRFELRDRVRNLRLVPWREAAGDGARLRLAAARAALARMDAAWEIVADPTSAPEPPPDLVVATGGAFSLAPAPAVGLAVVDAIRRAGASALYLDHARVLAPIGTLESETDRRRLLADLLDDILVPLGSAVVAAGLRPGRRAGTLRVASEGTTTEVELVPGAVQLVDLPPGIGATIEIETREGAWVGVKARRVALDVVGGLGGLLVDTRDVPLRLPERAERRRELLDAWQRPLWPVGEG